MPWQLIYTSAPRGLLSGQSGFCTVARSAALREALVQRLEQISSYHYLRVTGAATVNRNPTVSSFRLLDLRGAKYYVLTRIQPCGLDFTSRTNHLAHHLVFQPDELERLPSPAAILRHWPGWLSLWSGEPRLLDEVDPAELKSVARNFLPARTWAQMTGDGGRAAGLLQPECVRGCYLVCPPGSEERVLDLFCESLQLLNFSGEYPLRPWNHTFTAFLQADDNPNDFQWRACQEDTPAYKQALTRSTPLIPISAVRVPANSLVKLAREEPKPPSVPAKPSLPARSNSPVALNLRREASTRGSPGVPLTVHSLRNRRPVRAEKPASVDVKFSVNPATLASVIIVVVVLAGLFLVKRHYSGQLPDPETSAPGQTPKPKTAVDSMAAPGAVGTNVAPGIGGAKSSGTTPVVQSSATGAGSPAVTPRPAPASSKPFPTALPSGGTSLNSLMDDGPSYVLVVNDLDHFSLPIETIARFQNLLGRYDKVRLPPDGIQLAFGTDHWEAVPGSPVKVESRKGTPKFSASGSGMTCEFNYSDWLSGNHAPLVVDAHFDRPPGAFSLHFGFAEALGGDPFRLLVIDVNNPPPPLHLSKEFLQNDRQGRDIPSLSALRACLANNFILLPGREWQRQPFRKPQAGRAQLLYADWPSPDRPVSGGELEFDKVKRHLREEERLMARSLESLHLPPDVPLGKLLQSPHARLESITTFSPDGATADGFLAYLEKLVETAPHEAWIKSWNPRSKSHSAEEVSRKLQELYALWIDKQPQDQPQLTLTTTSGTMNYFQFVWQRLKEVESLRDQINQVKGRLDQVDQVAYIGLLMVDPVSSSAVEVIRFDGPFN